MDHLHNLNPATMGRSMLIINALRGVVLGAMIFLIGDTSALAEDVKGHKNHDMASEHGGQIFHKFHLESDYGTDGDDNIVSWDFDGWVGTDDNKLWLKSEGEHKDNTLETTEFWAMYSRNIATFWDAQVGIRHDTEPTSTSYVVVGFSCLAPYWFEIEMHMFISDEGDMSAKLHVENEWLITQKLILQPYGELHVSAQDVPERDIGAGFTDGKIGLQTRYEFTRKFAPYIDVHYGRKLGQTSSISKDHGEDRDEFVGAIGLRLMF